MKFDRSKFSEITQLAIEAAIQSGKLLKQGYSTQFEVSYKPGKHNLVTEYDIASEKQILSLIRETYPDHNFLCEEEGVIQSDTEGGIKWIIDPLDGTVNFAHNIPVFAVSIAVFKDNEPFCGVVYAPMYEELFVGEKSKGAFLNGEKISVTKIQNLEDSFLSTGFPYNMHENPHHIIERFGSFIKKGIPIRRLGSATLDLTYVAAGRFDGYWETGLGAWDCAAALVIIQEAGGKVSNWDGSDFKLADKNNTILATNGHIHEEMVQQLKDML